MILSPFKLERYFAKYEFTAKYLLSSSDCDGLPISELVDMADSQLRKLWDNLTLGYTDSLGNPLLREEVAKLYNNILPDHVLIITPEEGIFLALNALLKAGDHVICTFPGYQSLYEIAQGIGCEVTKWYPEEENGWRFNPELLEQSIKPNTKLIVFNFPHNPTGYLPTQEDYIKIMEIAQNKGIYIFSDEMYRFLEFDSASRLPSACEVYDKAVSLFGMSKTFGMAGVRIGWIITRDKKFYKDVATLKDYTTICSSAPSEILSIMALRAKDYIILKHLQRINRNLGILDGFFNTWKDMFSWVKPRAGTIGFPKLTTNLDSASFCQKVVTEANIMLLPSQVYDYDNKHFRLGFGRENFPEALSILEEFLTKNYKERQR